MLPITPLSNAFVRLVPLAPDHLPGLRAAAVDPALWRWWPRPGLDRAFDDGAAWLRGELAAGRMIAFTVFHGEAIVGQTCFLALRPEHAGVEIGHTWYARGVQGSAVNPAAKCLMLDHAFTNGIERVELKTDALNVRSRAAILKLGAAFEGVFRHHMWRPDGTWRDTAWYSILAAEWPDVRDRLTVRLAAAAGRCDASDD